MESNLMTKLREKRYIYKLINNYIKNLNKFL